MTDEAIEVKESNLEVNIDNSELLDYFKEKDLIQQEVDKSLDEENKKLEEESTRKELESREQLETFQSDVLRSLNDLSETQVLVAQELTYIKVYNEWLLGLNTLLVTLLICIIFSIFFSKQSR